MARGKGNQGTSWAKNLARERDLFYNSGMGDIDIPRGPMRRGDKITATLVLRKVTAAYHIFGLAARDPEFPVQEVKIRSSSLADGVQQVKITMEVV